MRTRMDGVNHKHRNISSAHLYETDSRLCRDHTKFINWKDHSDKALRVAGS